MFYRISTIIFCLIFAGSLQAKTIHVPSDEPTIQKGIQGATAGDTVLVQPGTYVENIIFNRKNIIVASLFLTTQDTSYITRTIIDGDSSHSVVLFQNVTDTSAALI